MSLLAHLIYAAPRMDAEKRGLDARIQFEIREARRLQEQTGCTWTEALLMAARDLRDKDFEPLEASD